MGGAVQAACADVKQQLLALASELLEVDSTDLEIADGQVRVTGAPARALDFGAIVRRSRRGNLLGQGRHRAAGALDPDTGLGVGPSPGHWHQSVGAVEVEVDLDTGKVELLRYRAGIYAGRVVNRVQAELQTEGSVAFGLGQALFEEMVFDNGQLQNGNLGDYMIASAQDLPRELDVDLLEHPDRTEIHGLGEPSLPPVMPAVGNAVYRATGVRIRDLPITPEKILRGLKQHSA
jgi:CO/xanthine dehydrogenase Mo-binding subunit